MNKKDAQIAYLLIRLTMGLNFFMHGVVRIFGHLDKFREKTVTDFQETWLPQPLVDVFATILPFFEGTIGLLLLLGLFTRQAIMAGAVVMMVLIFGTSLRQDWALVGSQIVYSLFFYFLMRYAADNAWSLDSRRKIA
ncbi:DoxX family membrane protein [Salmonirosea aquatica]|uniref:DoxX family membrane protein n=1 Tax=Salmonirosea aquatica TaxID=2654236 RepID=A0A7C9BFB4_9BACT|nr:DoxX family membrane protein [Cytophagaceae bacterium SJW1-29]